VPHNDPFVVALSDENPPATDHLLIWSRTDSFVHLALAESEQLFGNGFPPFVCVGGREGFLVRLGVNLDLGFPASFASRSPVISLVIVVTVDTTVRVDVSGTCRRED